MIIADMIFNLGFTGWVDILQYSTLKTQNCALGHYNFFLSRLSKFKKMKAAIEKRDWVEAAAEMKDSL